MYRIVKAKYSDAEAALEIRRAAILTQCIGHYPLDIVTEWAGVKLSDEFAHSVAKDFYLAKYGDQIVGTGMINIKTGKIDAIFVHPDHMHKGVGKKIIRFLERVGLNHGLKTLTLQSTLNAAEFYRACGFVGNELDTYTTARGVSIDCIPMAKAIVQ